MNKVCDYQKRLYHQFGGKFTLVNEKSDTKEKYQELLDMIYSVDERGLPSGDIAVFLGDKANAEVKAFIQSQMMQDNSSDGDLLSMSEDLRNNLRSKISDDDIAEFSRNHGETNEEYASRLKRHFDKVRAENRRDAEINRLKKLMDSDEP